MHLTSRSNVTLDIPSGNVDDDNPACWWRQSSTISSPVNTCNTPSARSEPAAWLMACFSSLTWEVEHSQVTAMQPSLTLVRWRWVPGTPSRPTSLVRSSSVRSPQKFCSFSLTCTLLAESTEGVADAGIKVLNWLSVVLLMKCWHCCSYSRTRSWVAVLQKR